jgi:hypothetical protein
MELLRVIYKNGGVDQIGGKSTRVKEVRTNITRNTIKHPNFTRRQRVGVGTKTNDRKPNQEDRDRTRTDRDQKTDEKFGYNLF